jgi:hypothetical protein
MPVKSPVQETKRVKHKINLDNDMYIKIKEIILIIVMSRLKFNLSRTDANETIRILFNKMPSELHPNDD